MIFHLLASTASDEHWAALLGLVSAILVLLGMVARFAWRVVRVIDGQLEAMAENTRAVRELTRRVDKLEAAHPDPPRALSIR